MQWNSNNANGRRSANFWTWPDLWFPRSASPKMQQRHTGYHNAQSAHVQRAHDIEEYRQEVDIKEVAE